MIRIILTGETVPAGRPRFTRKGFAYQPAKTRAFQHDLRLRAQDAMDGQPLLTGPLDVTVIVRLPIPTSFSFKKKQLAVAGALRPITRPDLDNYIKQLDALNNVVWLDDSQIVEMKVSKEYSERPGIEVLVDSIATAQKLEQSPLFAR